jgi:hypothetical protein
MTVDEECGCTSIEELICCGQAVGKGEAAARKARTATAASAPAVKKAVAKKAKSAAKKPATRVAAAKKASPKAKPMKVAKKK